MAKTLAVHGIAQQYASAGQLRSSWINALQDHFDRAGNPEFLKTNFGVVFWGDLFRDPAKLYKSAVFYPSEIESADPDLEFQLLLALEAEAKALLTAPTGARSEYQAKDVFSTSREFAQERALQALSEVPGFKYLASRNALDVVLLGNLRQVAAYLTDRLKREAILQRFHDEIDSETRVVIGHSLGSVVAYEALCAGCGPNVRLLLTLGSPLGMKGLIFDRLTPPPKFGMGTWPGHVKRWVNVAGRNDVVAMVKDLRESFGNEVENWLIDNGGDAHNAERYLTEKEVGKAIVESIS